MIYETWGRVRDKLLPAMKNLHGLFKEDDLLVRWLAGKYRLWERPNSAMLSEVVEFPAGNVLSVALAGGQMEELKEILAEAEVAAKQAGFKGVMIVGREGWARMFPEYKFAYTMIYKELNQ